jgi:hypothetical protein
MGDPVAMPGVRCLYDLYHVDPLPGHTYAEIVPSLNQAAAAGWPLFMHKLSQGLFADPAGVGRLQAAGSSMVSGIGGYLFMTTTNSAASQIAMFMKQRGLVGAKLVNMLDFEPASPNRAAERIASAIVNGLHDIFGVWPLLYTGRWSITPIPLDNLPACPLMLAEYGTAPIPPPKWGPPVWHQYSDGAVGPDPVDIPGIGLVDQSEFLGGRAFAGRTPTLPDALAWWQANAV